MSHSTSAISLPPSADRSQLEALQAKLADRASTVRFAHAGVSMLAALIMAGASSKLFWDSRRFPVLGVIAAALSLTLAAYSVVQYRRGKRHLELELQLFASMQGLRHKLGLEDPSVLLPP